MKGRFVMNKKTFTIEILLDWQSLSPDGQEKVMDKLMDPVLEEFEDEMIEEANEEWDGFSEELKKKFSYSKVFEERHYNKVFEIASRLKGFVGMEVNLWRK